MIFTNSYIDPCQIAAIVQIAIWQPNRFVHDLAPIFVVLVAKSSFSSHISTTPVSPFPPDATQETTKTKKWGQSDKDHLYDLIQTGQVDIGDLSLDYIEAVHQEHFHHRVKRNFCRPLRLTSMQNIAVRNATKGMKVRCGVCPH